MSIQERLFNELEIFLNDIHEGYEKAGFEIEDTEDGYRNESVWLEGDNVLWSYRATDPEGKQYAGACILCTTEQIKQYNPSPWAMIRQINQAHYYNVYEIEEAAS